MSKNVLRSSMYETNSSSVHTIVFSGLQLEPSKLRTKNGYTITEFGSFGKEFVEYHEQASKLSYLASLVWYIYQNYNLDDMYDTWEWEQLEKAVCEYNGTKGIRLANEKDEPEIDHQSIPDYGYIDFIDLGNIETLRQFIFCPNLVLRTDCD